MDEIIIWIYIALLIVGGLIGGILAKSKISLYLSLVMAGLMVLANTKILVFTLNYWLLGILVVVFAARLARTRRFMPAGFMLSLTILTLILIGII